MTADGERDGLLDRLGELRTGRARAWGFLLGSVYSLVAFAALIRLRRDGLGTWSFLVGVPAALAMIPYLLERAPRPYTAFAVPMFGLVAASGVLWLVGQESGICVLVIVAPMIVIGSLAALALLFFRERRVVEALRRKGLLVLLPFLLPLAGALVEDAWLATPSTAVVSRAIDVDAQRDAVFAHIVEVAPLTERELPKTWLNALGVPRPVRATVDRHGSGGLRVGHFEGGLRFHERIAAFEPARRLSLAVTADTSAMSQDDVTVHAFDTGLFSVDEVEYRLEEGPRGARLVLSSRYTLRSTVNVYGHLWARALLASFEERLLAALRARIEGGASSGTGSVALER